MDVPQRRPAETDRGRNIQQTAVHQHDIRSVDRHIGTGSYGDAHIRGRQGRSIVDAVTDHCYAAFALQFPDLPVLAVRLDAGDHLIHAGLAADGAGRAFVISGQHDDADPHIPQLADRLRAVLPHLIGNGDDSQEPSARGALFCVVLFCDTLLCEEETCFPFLCQALCLLYIRCPYCRDTLRKGQIAAGQLPIFQCPRQAVSRCGAERGDLLRLYGFCFRCAYDSFRQRMFTAAFQRVRVCQQLVLGDAFRR